MRSGQHVGMIRCGFMIFLVLVWCQSAETMIQFPDWAHVIDVRQEGAKGDGINDDTAAIQRALDKGGKNTIVYFPPGTYLISRQLRFPPSKYTDSRKGGHKRTIIQGAGSHATILRLKPHAPGFQQLVVKRGRKKKKRTSRQLGIGVIWCGTAPAQRFRNAIRDITIEVGEGNPAACGLQFVANNQGCIRNVILRAAPNSGYIGLDLGYTGENGPLYIRDLKVEGFRIGIDANAFNSVTMEHIQLSGQREIGIVSRHLVFVRDFTSHNRCPAIKMEKNYSVLVLDQAEMSTSQHASAAIIAEGMVVLRDIRMQGYPILLQHMGDSKSGVKPQKLVKTDITLWCSHQKQGFRESTVWLPVEESPTPAWENDFSKWINPLACGAKGDGVTDDTAAIQKAVDTPGKTVLCFPAGKRFRIEGKVLLRGSITRVLGAEGTFFSPAAKDRKQRHETGGWFEVVEGAAPVVVFERIDNMYGRTGIRQKSSRTLIIADTSLDVEVKGPGKVFLEDVVGSLTIDHPGARVWARQLNCENPNRSIRNKGGKLWILGLKTENRGNKIWCGNDGVTEVFGAHIYSNTTFPARYPLIDMDNAEGSFLGWRETWFGKDKPFEIYLRARFPGQRAETILRRQFPAGRFIPVLQVRGKQVRF